MSNSHENGKMIKQFATIFWNVLSIDVKQVSHIEIRVALHLKNLQRKLLNLYPQCLATISVGDPIDFVRIQLIGLNPTDRTALQ